MAKVEFAKYLNHFLRKFLKSLKKPNVELFQLVRELRKVNLADLLTDFGLKIISITYDS